MLLCGAAQANSGEESGGEESSRSTWGPVVFDAAVLRPLYAMATVVGAAAFVPAAVMTSPGGRTTVSEVWDTFVMASVEDVFRRPLGEFEP